MVLAASFQWPQIIFKVDCCLLFQNSFKAMWCNSERSRPSWSISSYSIGTKTLDNLLLYVQLNLWLIGFNTGIWRSKGVWLTATIYESLMVPGSSLLKERSKNTSRSHILLNLSNGNHFVICSLRSPSLLKFFCLGPFKNSCPDWNWQNIYASFTPIRR